MVKKIIFVENYGSKYIVSTYTDWEGSNEKRYIEDTIRKALDRVVKEASGIY